MLDDMTRHTKIGLFVAVAFVLVTTPIGLLSWNNQTLNSIGQALTLPALPVVYVLGQFIPGPMGEPEISPWDYFMLSVGILVSALFWGLVAGIFSRCSTANPHDIVQQIGCSEPRDDTSVPNRKPKARG
jgi:hypothetical protein